MKLTSPFLTRSRREAIALAAREQINAGVLRLQRNAYRDHLQRLTEALEEVNRAWAAPPQGPDRAPWSPAEAQRVTKALQAASALARMATAYDDTQRAAQPDRITVQEN